MQPGETLEGRQIPCGQGVRRDDFVRPSLKRYLPVVLATALRRAASQETAEHIASAVFAAFRRRAPRLGQKVSLPLWLYEATRIASAKARPGLLTRLRNCPPRLQLRASHPGILLDHAIDRLPPRLRNVIVLRIVFGASPSETAQQLRISPQRADRRFERGMKILKRALRKRRVAVEPEALACAFAPLVPAPGLDDQILRNLQETRTPQRLTRQTLFALGWARWRRRLVIGTASITALFALIIPVALSIEKKVYGNSHLFASYILWSVRHSAKSTPGLAQEARAWMPPPGPTAKQPSSPGDFYRVTNIWTAELAFSDSEWKALEPRKVGPMPHFLQPNGTVELRNPRAQRSGLAGVLGYDFDWTRGDLTIAGTLCPNVAVRFKGNGTYLASLYGLKRSFKIDLNRFRRGQTVADGTELNFSNLIDDRSYMSDALAYELFRDAGVPAPRTAYAWLTLSVGSKWAHKPLGLYLLVEPVDSRFAADRFGTKKVPIFKPVTYRLFEDLGDSWSAYAATYDLKTKASSDQVRRVIEFSQLVSHASDAEFAAKLGTFLDLDEFARFLAIEVLLAHYDSLLSNGQNFYLFLDPRSGKFGFIPWDLDHAWGSFPFIGTRAARERASIWHPWVGPNRFLERVMAAEAFRGRYRQELERASAKLFEPARLTRRIEEIAAVIRDPVSAESSYRLHLFQTAVDSHSTIHSAGVDPGPNRPVHQLQPFIRARAKSVRQQLDGTTKGLVLQRNSSDSR